eukprot:Hpha_TRINITY_DN31366_c0_g1::TRINITY_DN31366_c0_g1_i1::g.194562::m.194562
MAGDCRWMLAPLLGGYTDERDTAAVDLGLRSCFRLSQSLSPQRGGTERHADAGVACAAGNELFAIGDYSGAVEEYTAALAASPGDSRLLANRSAAFLAAKNGVAALRDAVSVVERRPEWVKGHVYAGLAFRSLALHGQAAQAFGDAAGVASDGDGTAALELLRNTALADAERSAAGGRAASEPRAASCSGDSLMPPSPNSAAAVLWRPLGVGGDAAEAVRRQRLQLSGNDPNRVLSPLLSPQPPHQT